MSAQLQAKFLSVRQKTMDLCLPLENEDFVVQSAAFVSPPKWHLGHTTWFFENFILKGVAGYQLVNEKYNSIYNSYYKSQGEHWVQANRGHLSRPTVCEIVSYRQHVNEKIVELIDKGITPEQSELLITGIHHEQQHQELLLMDIQHNGFVSPIEIKWQDGPIEPSAPIEEKFIEFDEGLYQIGLAEEGFAYCNERPSHKVFLAGFGLANRAVNCGEYLEFITDGGYSDFRHWSSEGWDHLNAQKKTAPLFWQNQGGQWWIYSLYGWHPIDLQQPVAHLNQYEAQAYAHWRGKRLPTEAEWERASQSIDPHYEGHFLEQKVFSPLADSSLAQGDFFNLMGDLWEWTGSSYSAYPGYKRPSGAMGEYNSKFMCGQYVLRGGSFATPREHIRKSYRNFYYPSDCWMFSGLRLAEDLK